MRFPIDVVFLDHDLVVLRIDPGVRPFHTSSCRGAREVVELAAGECARRGLAVGDRVAWASHAAELPPAVGPRRPPLESEPKGRVIVASGDARFVKLARFLLDGKGIETVATVPSEKLLDALDSETGLDALLLDAQDAVAATLATANEARTLRPDVPIVIVGETRAAERSPAGVRIYDKWNETDELIAAVESLIDEHSYEPEESPLGQGA